MLRFKSTAGISSYQRCRNANGKGQPTCAAWQCRITSTAFYCAQWLKPIVSKWRLWPHRSQSILAQWLYGYSRLVYHLQESAGRYTIAHPPSSALCPFQGGQCQSATGPLADYLPRQAKTRLRLWLCAATGSINQAHMQPGKIHAGQTQPGRWRTAQWLYFESQNFKDLFKITLFLASSWNAWTTVMHQNKLRDEKK